MITIGVDFHKRTSTYHVLDPDGQKLKRCKFENKPELMARFFHELPEGPKQLAMEATRSWGLFYETVKPYVDQFHLGHPKKMKAITESETKNDHKDAELIARLTQSGFLPKAHVSSLDTRELRSLLRFRGFLVNERRSIRNQVQTLIDRNLWPSERPGSFKDPFCKRGLQWLGALQLPERERFILDQLTETFHELSQKILDLEAFIKTQTPHLPGLTFLRTVPGFKTSKVNAYIVLLEASDITRFHKARGFNHYAGLIPREYSSGDHHRTGRLIKGANMHLRTALIESTLAAIRADRGLRAYYKSVKARQGSGTAIIATARKLGCVIYYVLKEQRAYRPEPLNPPVAACHSSAVTPVNG
jgi:transposase